MSTEAKRAEWRRADARRRSARKAAGLCLRCGKVPALPDSTACEPCREKCRARDRERWRAKHGSKPRVVLTEAERAQRKAQRRERERQRDRARDAARRAAGVCTSCGTRPAAPDRVQCEPCLRVSQARETLRYWKAKRDGLPYAGRNPERKRAAGRIGHTATGGCPMRIKSVVTPCSRLQFTEFTGEG